MNSSASVELTVAWISRGRLFVRTGQQPVREIESDFARQSLERDARDQEHNAWKGRSGVWGNMGIQPPGVAPWQEFEARRLIRFVTVARGSSSGHILYVLDMGTVGGLFSYDLENSEERRLVHRQGYVASGLSRHPSEGDIVMALPRTDGTTGLRVTRADGLFGKDITMTDSLDESPQWLPDGSRKILFQSCMIGRNEHGHATGKSTWRIEMLDLNGESVSMLHEEDQFDLLQPQMTDDGSLWYIRRPWKPAQRPEVSFLQLVQDVVFFPYRLARTIVYFLNFLSMMFVGKSMISADGPDRYRPPVNPWLMLWGQAVDTRVAASRSASGAASAKPLVPKNWQLMKRTKGGEQSALAESVVSYDIGAAGDVVYTDGRSIFHLAPGGAPSLMHSGELIERLIIVE